MDYNILKRNSHKTNWPNPKSKQNILSDAGATPAILSTVHVIDWLLLVTNVSRSSILLPVLHSMQSNAIIIKIRNNPSVRPSTTQQTPCTYCCRYLITVTINVTIHYPPVDTLTRASNKFKDITYGIYDILKYEIVMMGLMIITNLPVDTLTRAKGYVYMRHWRGGWWWLSTCCLTDKS